MGIRDSHAEDFNYRQDFDRRVLNGFKLSPVPLDLRNLDPALVGLGSYIVNAQGGCNLTPRANGLPANLTYDQFREVMRKGTDFKNRHPQISPLLQVMPWPVYGNMSNLELHAIYEFLRAIPSLPTTEPPSTPPPAS